MTDRSSGREPTPSPWPTSPDGAFAARRLDAAYAQISHAARIVQLSRALVDPLAGVGNRDRDTERLRAALADYDRAAERSAALDTGR